MTYAPKVGGGRGCQEIPPISVHKFCKQRGEGIKKKSKKLWTSYMEATLCNLSRPARNRVRFFLTFFFVAGLFSRFGPPDVAAVRSRDELPVGGDRQNGALCRAGSTNLSTIVKLSGRRLNDFLGLSLNDGTILFLVILLDKTVSVG